MKIAISAESTIDMSKELLDKFDIRTVPFTVILGDTEYKDGEIDNEQIFKYVAENKTLPKTSAVNEFAYEEHFNSLLKDYDAVVHLTLSGELSSSFKNAQNVAEKLKNVYIVDSRTLSTGIALLAIRAREMATEGLEAQQIADKLRELTPKVQASFVLDKLNYMHKGGRCSSITLLGTNLLSIKPQIIVEDGKMKVGKKYMGKLENAIRKYCQDVLSSCKDGVELNHAFITYPSASEQMIEIARQALTDVGFKNIYTTTAGGTITCHCGPNTLGILFIKK